MNRPELSSPLTIDINMAGKCNLGCEWCWGPRHDLDQSMNLGEWQGIILEFNKRGTTNLVFSGGEPLLLNDTINIAKYAKSELGMHVTLSTNGMYHNELVRTLVYVDEVGIPVDGSNMVLNEKMRGSKTHFDKALQAMQLVKSSPDKHLTVRTIVSKQNIGDMVNIGELLVSRVHPDRWKLYQYTPTGAYGPGVRTKHEISTKVFNNVVDDLVQKYANLSISRLSIEDRSGRYVFIMPNGNVSAVDSGGVKYIHLGNIIENPSMVFNNFIVDAISEHHLTHGLLRED